MPPHPRSCQAPQELTCGHLPKPRKRQPDPSPDRKIRPPWARHVRALTSASEDCRRGSGSYLAEDCGRVLARCVKRWVGRRHDPAKQAHPDAENHD